MERKNDDDDLLWVDAEGLLRLFLVHYPNVSRKNRAAMAVRFLEETRNDPAVSGVLTSAEITATEARREKVIAELRVIGGDPLLSRLFRLVRK